MYVSLFFISLSSNCVKKKNPPPEPKIKKKNCFKDKNVDFILRKDRKIKIKTINKSTNQS